MRSKIKTVTLFAAICMAPALNAQFDFKLGEHKVQIHSFASQGFMYTDQNNYLSAETSKGAFSPTDAGLNVSTQLSDKFRVGAQVYLFNVGQLGKWRPELDWTVAGYKFKTWFGIRGEGQDDFRAL
jgi:hypothetical protein